MKRDIVGILVLIILVLVGIIGVEGLFMERAKDDAKLTHMEMRVLKLEAVNKGYADFNTTNGFWQWKQKP